MSLKVFISYSHKDEDLCKGLVEHLKPLVRSELILPWRAHCIRGGEDWAGKIDENLKSADLILLIVSSSFVASDYCWDIELEYALKCHGEGKARVIPIIVRHCDWQTTPFSKLQAFPRGALPVEAWESQDEAWTDVVKQLREVVAELQGRREVTGKVAAPKVIGVDVGGTKIAAGLLDFSRSLKEVEFRPVLADIVHPVSGFGLLKQVGDMIESLLEAKGLETRDILGVGIAAPGQVDRMTGELVFGPNLNVRGVAFKEALRARFTRDLQVRVDNDARCATRCELHYGAVGKGCKNLICIFVGTGMGSGLVIDRRIYYGRGCAGEIGHTTLKLGDTEAPRCNCGQLGCLEVYVNGPGISRLAKCVAREWKKEGRFTRLQPDDEAIDPRDIVSYLKEQDEGAREVTRIVAEYLGHGLANYIHIVEPDAIVLGGGVMAGFYDFMSSDIRRTVDQRCQLHLRRPRIIQAEFMTEGAAIGAALLFHPDEDWGLPE